MTKAVASGMPKLRIEESAARRDAEMLMAAFQKQRKSYLADPVPDLDQRKADLKTLKRMLNENRDALIEAGRRRLRPILMTTLTTILGLLPLALGIGEGSDAQAPLARAVVGGLTGSTLITLVLIPVVYSLFHPDLKKRRN